MRTKREKKTKPRFQDERDQNDISTTENWREERFILIFLIKFVRLDRIAREK